MLRLLFKELIDLLVPPRGSERLVRGLTDEIIRSLDQEDGLPYRDPRVTAIVWEIKYYANGAAVALVAELLAEKILAASAEELGTPLLIPVPMHQSRRAERGHNQTELLCEAALPHLYSAVEYAPFALVRMRATPTQQGLPRQLRLRNVGNSMRALPQVEGRVCIVVDDVTTTEATLDEAKRALRAGGARAVHTIALARS